MVDVNVISETPINIYQLKAELERTKKRDNELNFRASRTDDYLSQITHLKNAGELFNKLMKLEIPRLKESHVHKIIDILPENINELKVILQGYNVTINAESMKKIVDTINEFSEKNK